MKIGYYESRDFQEGAADGARKSGYGYEYLQRVASYAGWHYEYVYGTWTELYQKLCDGEIDMLAGVSETEGREHRVKFPSSSMLSETFYIYDDASNETIDGDDPATFAGARIGVVAGSNAQTAFDEWLGETGCGATAVEFATFDDMRAAFDAGDVVAIVSADNVVHGEADMAPAQIVGKAPYYLAVANGRSDLLMRLNEVLAIMNSQDRVFLDSLQSRYAADSSVNVYITADEKRWMAQHATLTVGYLDDYLPYCDTDSDGRATGLMVDVLGEMLDRLPGDWTPDIQTRAFANQADLIAAVNNGEIDLAFPVGGGSWYAEEHHFLLSSPVVSPSMNLVARGIDNLADEPASVAVNSNNLLQRLYVERAFPDAAIVECDSIDDCLSAVVSGKAVATVVNGLRASALLSSEPALASLQLPESDDRCFGASEENGVLLQLVNRGLGIIGENYGTDASYDYTAGLFKYTFYDFLSDNWAVIAAIATLACAAAVALAYRRYRRLCRENMREIEQNRRLGEALAQAERASHAKDELLANLSHDMRTPLNGILGMMDINDSCDDPAVARANREKARSAARQLLGLVDDLLEMSKLKSGDFQMAREEFLLADVVDAALADVRAYAAGADVTVLYSGHSRALSAMRVVGSPTYMRQILMSVLDNAVRYNKSGGRVVLEADLARGESRARFTCSITDTGVGMSEEYVARIFEPFSQGEQSARSVYQGSGLGMAIVKSLVEFMGGEVVVESHAGQGTRVGISLPFDVAEVCEAGHAANAAPSIEGMRVMVVEDNDLNLEIAKCVVERAGAKVVAVARDGAQAVETFAASPAGSIDAILMDVMMPVMNGYDAARAIRRLPHEDARGVIIVALTAKAFESDRAEALAAGMDEHLPKPLDAERMIAVLARCRRQAQSGV